MNKVKLLFLFFFLNIYSTLFSQINIYGTVKTLEQLPLSDCYVFLINDENNNVIKYTLTDNEGKYNFEISQNLKKIRIKCQSFDYKLKEKKVIISNKKKYIINFIVEKKENILKEVVLEVKKNKIIQKKDTTIFNVPKLKKAGDVKLIDLLKHLPGFNVNTKTGRIQFKGKEVESLLIEGSDLFDYNYSIGTRNINLDIIKQIQAIENYSENELLRGIEKSDKVAINLVLKNSKFSVTGSLDSALGLMNKNPVFIENSDLLGIKKTIKFFSKFSYNNIGKDNSSFDLYENSFNLEQLKEQKLYANKIINQSHFQSLFENNTGIFNNQLTLDNNMIYNLSKRSTLKLKTSFIKDDLRNSKSINNNYYFDNNLENVFLRYNTHEKPLYFKTELTFNDKIKQSANIEDNLKFLYNNILTQSLLDSNFTQNNKEVNLSSKKFFIKNDFLFTKKITEKTVLQIYSLYSKDNISQDFKLSPSFFNYKQDIQTADVEKHSIIVKFSLIGKLNNANYTLETGFTNFNDKVLSDLSNVSFDNSLNVDNINNVSLDNKNLYQKSTFLYTYNKWSFLLKYKINYNTLKYTDEKLFFTSSKKYFYFEPTFKAQYKLKTTSYLYAIFSINKKNNIVNHLFPNRIIIDANTIVKNDINLELKNKFFSRISYINYNLFNQFEMNIGLSYNKINGNYFSKYELTPYLTQLRYFFLKNDNDNYNFDLHISKFIPKLNLKISINSIYSNINYHNIVNNSDIRNNNTSALNTSISFATTFNFFVNFKNTLEAIYLSSGNTQNGFQNNSLKNIFQINFRKNKNLYANIKINTIFPDMKNSDNRLWLVNSYLKYNWNKKTTMFLVANNILNKNSFIRKNVNDFSIITDTESLLPRYFMLGISYTIN